MTPFAGTRRPPRYDRHVAQRPRTGITRGAEPPAQTLVRRRRSDGENTRQRVIDAAIKSILESGYYHTSSNEIARLAGVTWGALQNLFGTREALMLDIVNDRWHRLQEAMATAEIDGDTLEERLHAVLDLIEEHYGTPEHLARIQILLDLAHNPNTSAETRAAVAEHGRRLTRAWQPLFRRVLGDAAGEEDLVRYAFTTLRGYLVGGVIARSIADTRSDRVPRELLVRGVAAAVRSEASARGIPLD
jgi:AcrR family transcriptional regulator